MSIQADQQKCLDFLEGALEGLGVVAAREKTQKISNLIVGSMSGQWRLFHTPDHIFQVGLGSDDIEVISALFHDSIYVQVDEDIDSGLLSYIASFISVSDKQIFITNESKFLDDASLKLCLMTFGFDLGQRLISTEGQNEFLSALFAAKVLEDSLPLPILSQVISCIEATIPFRESDHEGISCSEQQYRNLKKINQVFEFSWTEDGIQKIVERGVRLANRDVFGFASESPGCFLDDTWKLIPETNHDLWPFSICTISTYRVALQKMEIFLSTLKAESVIRKYKNEPSDEKYAHLIYFTKRNLEIACAYLGVKLLSCAVLEALSSRSFKEQSSEILRVELTENSMLAANFESSLSTKIPEELLSLLKQKRSLELGCDAISSPIGIFILKEIELEDAQSLLYEAHQFFSGELSSEDFLSHCPRDLITGIMSSTQLPSDTK